MVRYSAKAAQALSFLKRSYNDVDIYVEDTSSPNMWICLLRTMLPQSIKLGSVNMLGGRDAVIAACKNDQIPTDRKKLYIIDGDFDFIYRKSKPKLKYLYRTRAYCVENILLNIACLLKVGMVAEPKKPEAQILSMLDLDSFNEEVKQNLIPLFLLYAIAHYVGTGTPTVSYNVNQLYDNSSLGVKISPIKVRKRIRQIGREICSLIGVSAFRSIRKSMEVNLDGLSVDQIVSGKDYLLPPIFIRFCKALGYKGDIDQFKVILASNFDYRAEPWFARRVRTLA